MKRVIEIHESDFKDIQEYDTIFEEENADIAKAIKTSESLDDVLDKIVAEIGKLSCFSFTMGNGKVVETPLVNKDVVANIVKKYKESEVK